MTYRDLALALVGTIRHDGRGGVADDLDTDAAFAVWLEKQPELPDAVPSAEAREQVVALRRAVRSLFARAVRPGPPSSADANRLVDPAVARNQVNTASAAVLRAPRLDWPDEDVPSLGHDETGADATTELLAVLARATIGFLTSTDREHLRACPAPRCVRYFVKEHPRQEWCKPSCGNRARVSRYYQRHHEA